MLAPEPVRTTEFAPALPPQNEHAPTRPASSAASAPASGYAPPATATRLGKLAASPAQTFHSNLMGPFGVQQGTYWPLMSDVEKSMAVCVSSIPPAFATAVRVRYVSNVNGTAVQRPNRARKVGYSIPWRWDRLRCSGGTGTDGTSGRRVCVCIASTWRFRLNQSSPSPKPLPRRRSLVLNVRITACHGMSGWLVMHEPKRLIGSPSHSSGFQNAWRPSSD